MISLYAILPLDGAHKKLPATKKLNNKVAPVLQNIALKDNMLVWVVYNNSSQD